MGDAYVRGDRSECDTRHAHVWRCHTDQGLMVLLEQRRQSEAVPVNPGVRALSPSRGLLMREDCGEARSSYVSKAVATKINSMRSLPVTPGGRALLPSGGPPVTLEASFEEECWFVSVVATPMPRPMEMAAPTTRPNERNERAPQNEASKVAAPSHEPSETNESAAQNEASKVAAPSHKLSERNEGAAQYEASEVAVSSHEPSERNGGAATSGSALVREPREAIASKAIRVAAPLHEPSKTPVS